MADYSTFSDQDWEAKVKTWNIIKTIALVLVSIGFICWPLIDSWHSNEMIFILLFGFISLFILFVAQAPRAMAVELKQRKVGYRLNINWGEEINPAKLNHIPAGLPFSCPK